MVKKLIERFSRWYWSSPVVPMVAAFLALILGVIVGRLLKPVIGG